MHNPVALCSDSAWEVSQIGGYSSYRCFYWKLGINPQGMELRRWRQGIPFGTLSHDVSVSELAILPQLP